MNTVNRQQIKLNRLLNKMLAIESHLHTIEKSEEFEKSIARFKPHILTANYKFMTDANFKLSKNDMREFNLIWKKLNTDYPNL